MTMIGTFTKQDDGLNGTLKHAGHPAMLRVSSSQRIYQPRDHTVRTITEERRSSQL